MIGMLVSSNDDALLDGESCENGKMISHLTCLQIVELPPSRLLSLP